MEHFSHNHNAASTSAVDADVLANAFLYDATITNASPSLSVLSTPGLESLDTPDTVISHDFDAYSPQLSSFDKFGRASTVFDRYTGHDPVFGDPNLFPSDEDLLSNALLDGHGGAVSRKSEKSRPELFVDAASLTLTPATETLSYAASVSSSPASPALSYDMAPPAFSRSNSSSSFFAVPKLPRGRKRKSSLAEDVDFVPPASNSKNKRKIAEDEEENEKSALRAKNTEAAARSRARKKAAMESAEQRIRELEAENESLRQLINEKDCMLAAYRS